MIATDTVTKSIAEYRQQYELLGNQIQQLEQNYQTQRTLAVNTLNQIAGAISALETLMQHDQPVPAPPPAPVPVAVEDVAEDHRENYSIDDDPDET